MKIKKVLPIFALSLVFMACGKKDVEQTDQNSTKNTEINMSFEDPKTMVSTDDNKSTTNENTKEISPMEAFKKAKEEFSDYQLESMSYDIKNNQNLYKVNLFKDNNEVSVYVDSLTAEVTNKKEEMDNDQKQALDEKYLENIPKYLEDVLNDVNKDGKTYLVKDWSIDTDDGRSLLDVEIYEKHMNKKVFTYKINPEDGKVLEKEIKD